MAKKNLLKIVQDILSDMNSDAVNSIDDTDEALQVAQIVQNTYEAIISGKNWPHTARTIQLSASTNSELPTHMMLVDDVKEMISVYYDKKKVGETRLLYLPVKYKLPDDFLYYTNSRNSDNANVKTVIDPSGVKLLVINNKAPDYFTSFDDTTLIFDSYDIEVDDTLQTSKTQVRAYVEPEFRMIDDYVPDLPSEAFSLLIQEATSVAQFKINQMVDQKAEQESKRQRSWGSRRDWRAAGGIVYPNYGRRTHRYRQEPTFKDEN